ncbi:hypothetical protein CDL12_01519 [Handroanthus impetiginosus]|uniref:Amino acid transporter transmembrane domain-containing protein n=1 Tax=Handroanthus impetiginosus TaxID=429701 RepID=A0A2G9I7I1_9LAMI|nr:hypothetical protein CDL12_01519 [Handroanthus impetiginosus]
MAEMLNVGVESTLGGSSRVTPVLDEVNIDVWESSLSLEVQDSGGTATDGGEEFSGERNPQDAWLPITESRKGNSLSAAFHLLCSGIGIQALLLPIGFVSLGWFWGILLLSVAFSWQLYTIWLLVDLHESSPPTGIRYSRFLHLSIVAFGEKLGKLLAIFPTLYLSGGTCVLYIITGGSTVQLFYQAIFEPNSMPLTGAECFLIFIFLAIFIAQFFPNLNSLASISLIGSLTALAYCSLLWVLSVSKGRPHDLAGESRLNGNDDDDDGGIRNVLNSIGIIALAFRGHNLVLEIQVCD